MIYPGGGYPGLYFPGALIRAVAPEVIEFDVQVCTSLTADVIIDTLVDDTVGLVVLETTEIDVTVAVGRAASAEVSVERLVALDVALAPAQDDETGIVLPPVETWAEADVVVSRRLDVTVGILRKIVMVEATVAVHTALDTTAPVLVRLVFSVDTER